jgi:hypothetical protein
MRYRTAQKQDVDQVRGACVEIFAGPDLHPWPPELVVPDDWREPAAARNVLNRVQ